MSYLFIGVVVVAGVVYYFMPKKKTAIKKMEKARNLFEKGEIIELNQMLDEVIVFSINGKYKADYVEHMLEALNFLKDVCKEQNINKNDLIDPIIKEMRNIQSTGGEISTEITDPLEDWISEMSKNQEAQVEQLLKEAENGNISVTDEDEDDFTSQIIDPTETKIINSVGGYMLKRKLNEGIAFLDSHMPNNMSSFKANLMDQKAAMYFMDGKVDKAADIYLEILNHYPNNNRIKTSLAEAYVESKMIEDAVELAKEVLKNSRGKDNIKTCQKIVKRYSK